MERENKPKRPRITLKSDSAEGGSKNYNRVDYNSRNTGSYDGERPQRNYNNDRSNNYHSNQNSYGNRPSRPAYGNNRSYDNNNYRGGNNYNNNSEEKNYNNEYGYNDSYASGLGERPQRSYNNDRPQRSYNNNGGERGNSYGNRPQRPYNNNGGERGNSYGDRPQRSYNNNGGERGNSYGDRPQRPYNNNGGERGNSYGDRPQRPYNNNRRNDRPTTYSGDRRPRRDGETPSRPIVLRKRIVYENIKADPSTEVRLNKFMANSGVCSRREADEHIKNGLVTVNGVVMCELGTKITYADKVEFSGKEVSTEQKVYVLLNKPKDCVTTSDDPQGRLTVLDIVRSACTERIYPVGRLDRLTTGVLLLTNDGDLASKLTHPKFVKKKIYHVWTDKDVTEEDMQRIADGIELEDGPIHADAVSYANDEDKNQVGIEIHSGRNRIVRRMFEALGYRVIKLDRVYFAGLTKKNLPRGRWRYLSQKEVDMLRMGAFE